MGLMRIYNTGKKRKKGKPTEKERELATEWAKTLAAHSGPLETGLKSRGHLPAAKKASKVIEIPSEVKPFKRENQKVPSLPMQGMATKPATDELAQAKKELRGRTGVNYNKGGIQYLTDLDLEEQKTGSHKRRT